MAYIAYIQETNRVFCLLLKDMDTGVIEGSNINYDFYNY